MSKNAGGASLPASLPSVRFMRACPKAYLHPLRCASGNIVTSFPVEIVNSNKPLPLVAALSDSESYATRPSAITKY
jgi:hypothetical protein